MLDGLRPFNSRLAYTTVIGSFISNKGREEKLPISLFKLSFRSACTPHRYVMFIQSASHILPN